MQEEMIEQLNRQINLEFFSAYFYLDVANYYTAENLDGFANWFSIQEREERDHAFFFIRYLQDNDHEVVLGAIDKPQCTLESPEDPLHAGL